jgi:MFS family permease
MHHHHDHFWWRFFPSKELTQIYVSTAIRSFANSLISLFIALYLHKEIGLTLQETLYFFIFYAVIFAISTPIAAKFSARFGLKHSILLSVPFYLAFVVLLYLLPVLNTPLMVIAALWGVSLAFYWMGLHLVFHHASHKGHRGEEFGKRAGISIFATMMGPLVGGFLIKFVGFKSVFVLASILLFSSALFLFLSKEDYVKYQFSLRNLLIREHWENSIFFTSRGVWGMTSGVIWPLFIFSILNDYLSLGIVGSLLAGVSAIFILLVGKYSDKIGKRKIIKWISGFESLSWFVRSAVVTTTHVFGATVFGALTHGIMESPIGALGYDKAKDKVAEYFVSREVYICLGRILVLIFVLMTNSLSSGLIFNGFTNLAALLF